MEKYQNRGQGTLNSIVVLVIFFIIIDVIIAFIIFFDIKIEDLFNPNTDNTITTTLEQTTVPKIIEEDTDNTEEL